MATVPVSVPQLHWVQEDQGQHKAYFVDDPIISGGHAITVFMVNWKQGVTQYIAVSISQTNLLTIFIASIYFRTQLMRHGPIPGSARHFAYNQEHNSKSFLEK